MVTFTSMGVSEDVCRAIVQKGYKIPTPIQRKVIPRAMEGRDVVAMARTGSGKSAAFLIPLLHKLKQHSSTMGARALIVSPTRDLADQTAKFACELGKHTDLRHCVLVGGIPLHEQFDSLVGNPDILIATPGRLCHLMEIANLNLSSVDVVVFDEADQLFELGFAEQLHMILKALPENRQTMLISATMPSALVEFTKAGLSDPAVLRLDVERNISENLKLEFLASRPEEKIGALMWLLRHVISEKDQTLVFASTKYHVEYIHRLLCLAGIKSTYIFGSMDPLARNGNMHKFRSGQCSVFVVTDVAARGIDLPFLNNVIHYDFPCKPKLFVHRSGRVARAGRSGTAYSLLVPDELAYLIDLRAFLKLPDETQYGCSRFPKKLLADETEFCHNLIEHSLEQAAELEALHDVCERAFKQYCRTRPGASSRAVRAAKQIGDLGVHPTMFPEFDAQQQLHEATVDELKRFRPSMCVLDTATKKAFKRPTRATLPKTEKESALQTVKQPRQPVSLPSFQDPKFFVSSTPTGIDPEREKEFAVDTNSTRALEGMAMDMEADDMDSMKKVSASRTWDARKRKFIRKNDKKTSFKESLSKKKNPYVEWKNKNKTSIPMPGSRETGRGKTASLKDGLQKRYRYPAPQEQGIEPAAPGRARHELKSPEEVLKKRKMEHKRNARLLAKKQQKAHKKKKRS